MIFERLFLGNKKFSFNQHHRQRVSFLVKKSYFFKATIFFLCLCGVIKTLKEAQEFLKDMKTPGTPFCLCQALQSQTMLFIA